LTQVKHRVRTPVFFQVAMSPLDAFWHAFGLIAPALGIAVLAVLLVKALWWRALAGVGWTRLLAWSGGASLAALVAGLAAFGRDGRMETYGAMVIACAAGLGWAGVLRARS
jgi:hypothetical protein